MVTRVSAPYLGRAAFHARVGVLGAAALAVFVLLGLRLWSLQVLQGDVYARQARAEETRLVALPAERGTIVDAEGRVLAGSAGELDVTADPELIGRTTAGGWVPTVDGQRLLRRLAAVAGTNAAVLISRIRSDLMRSPFAPATVLSAVPEPLASYLGERAGSFPGLAVTEVPVRGFPEGRLGGTFLGLLGQAGPGETVGRSGVEASYDSLLNGGVTEDRVHVDALGREVGTLRSGKPSRSVGTLQLTISARLQGAAQQALAYGIREAHVAGYPAAHAGAAVVMNPRTGAVEALASAPELDQAAAAGDPAYLRRVLHEAGGPLLDRATEGLYPLGSTFKPVVAEAALSAGLITPSTVLPCVASLTVGGIVFHNVESWVDASLTLPQALQISCDTWFYRLGEDFFFRQQRGQPGIQRWARLFGFGGPTGLDVPGEAAGIVPTPAWLERTLRQSWYEGDSVNLSIGQGFLEATPLQLAVAYSALANGGTVVRPHVGEAVIRDGRRSVLAFPPVRRLRLRGLGAIDQGLYLAANAPGGTSAAVFAGSPVVVAGKTGTAQTSTGSDDSWYASWAPARNPKVVVVVLIEHGGFGADAAAPAARRIYDAIFRPRRPAGPRSLASARTGPRLPGSAAARG